MLAAWNVSLSCYGTLLGLFWATHSAHLSASQHPGLDALTRSCTQSLYTAAYGSIKYVYTICSAGRNVSALGHADGCGALLTLTGAEAHTNRGGGRAIAHDSVWRMH